MRQFSRQPYRQLAHALTNEGDDVGARIALYQMEHLRRQKEEQGWLAFLRNLTFRVTVGYGYYPGRALKGLLLMVIAGFLFYWGGYAVGSIVPIDKDAYWSFKSDGQPPPYHGRFHAFLYSLENSFPLIRLGQSERWQPDPSPTWQPKAAWWGYRILAAIISPAAMAVIQIVQICLGWFLATMGVAAVSGIIRKE
jgi:hypothetical protein